MFMPPIPLMSPPIPPRPPMLPLSPISPPPPPPVGGCAKASAADSAPRTNNRPYIQNSFPLAQVWACSLTFPRLKHDSRRVVESFRTNPLHLWNELCLPKAGAVLQGVRNECGCVPDHGCSGSAGGRATGALHARG